MDSWEFGRTLRHWRDRVTPAAVGVPVGGRRRAAGLRREELAALAGISVNYLTRLEQGQARAPSAQVVEALARALRVSDAERDLLFRLAGHATPGLDVVSSRITPSVQRLLDRLANTPVAVFDATWTLLIANAPYDALLGQTTSWRGNERNSVWRNLIGPGTRVVHSPEEQAEFEALLVADLRLTASRYPADQRLKRLTRDLAAQSPRFVELWETGALGPHRDFGRHKVIDHPAVGRITLDCDTVIVAADDLRIMIYTAEPETEDAERLTLAIVLGTQALID
jgi:transcriptional regulator with XRE-family HTH domain